MKFSVAMCTYNGAAYLPEQLQSIAAQSRPPDELVVCDDCSTDETVRIVERFAARAGFAVRVLVNERNLGSTKNFERAIELCTGDVIALSDQDDVWHAEKLRRMEAVLSERPAVGAVFTNAEMVDEHLAPLGYQLWSQVDFDAETRREFEAGRAFQMLALRNVVTGATMAFRAEYRDLILPIPTDAVYLHDGWIAVMIAAVAELAFIDEPLILYRQHPRQQLGANWKNERNDEDGDDGVERASLAERLAESWQPRPILTEARKLAIIYERLAAKNAAYECAASMAKIRPRMVHLQARAGMPRAKLGRLPRVLRELLMLRYHHYSSGLRSAAKDLLS